MEIFLFQEIFIKTKPNVYVSKKQLKETGTRRNYSHESEEVCRMDASLKMICKENDQFEFKKPFFRFNQVSTWYL